MSEKKRQSSIKKIKLSKIWKKINLISETSEETQELLSGIRVYFSFLKQNSFINSFYLAIFTFLIIACFLITIFTIVGNYPLINALSRSIAISSIYSLFIILLAMLGLLRTHDFNFLKGLHSFVRIKISFLMLIYVFVALVYVSFGNFGLVEKASMIILFTFFTLFVLLVMSIPWLKSRYIIKYSIKKLQKTINNENKNNIYYQHYYYAILTYYKKITREFRNIYKDDVLIRINARVLPLLCSQGLIISDDDKKKLIVYLKELSEIDAINQPDKFKEILLKIEKESINKSIKQDKLNDIYEILKEKTFKETFKEYVFYLIAVLSIIGNLINIFLGDAIMAFLQNLI